MSYQVDSYGNVYFPAGVSVASIPTTTGTQNKVLVPGPGGRISSASISQLITQSGGNLVTSVYGRTGDVVPRQGDYDTDLVTEGQALYFTDSRARKALSVTTFNTSGPATYDSTTGIINIPQYGSGIVGNYVPVTRTITINGQTADLSANRIFSIDSMVYPSAGIPLSNGTSWGTSIVNNSANWNTAYGWGDHSVEGYLTSFTETDPTVASHIKAITTTNITNWNSAYSWGNHALAGYLTSFVETDPIWTSEKINYYTKLQADARYLQSYTETDPVWTSEKANYALKTYVDTSISNLIDSAPTTLDTLNELAAALGDDANFSTTITNLIGTKEPAITAGTTAQYWRGDKTWQTLPVYTLSSLGGEPAIAAGNTNQYWRGDKTWQVLPVYTLSGLGGVPNTRTLTINGTTYDLSANRSWTIAAGVSSFNTRTGDITLTSADVTGALGYTPYNSTNPSGYITGISSTTVINALGYTPYNSSNPIGYITSSASISGASARLSSRDNRVIAPSEDNAAELRFGFTAWNNNDAPDWADYLHLRSYSDSSGGADNLVMFKKSGIGMRIWQQSFGSGTAYSSYVDVLHSSNYNSYSPTLTGGGASGNWAISITGNANNITQYTINQNLGTGNSPSFADGIFGSTSGATDQGIQIRYQNYVSGYGRIRFYQSDSNHSTIHSFSNSWQNGSLAGHSTGAINIEGNTGVTIGAWNNADMWIDKSGNAQARGSLRAPIFYDSNDTSYYLDPNTTGVSLNVAGIVRGSYFVASNYASTGYTQYKGYDNNNHFIMIRGRVTGNTSSPTYTGYHRTSLVEYAEANDDTGWFFQTAATGNYDIVARITRSYSQFEGSVRAPLFYDSDNPSYYLDPNSNSRLLYAQYDNIGVGQGYNSSYRIITSGDIYLNSNGNGWAEGVWRQRRSGGTYYDVIDAGNIGSQSVNYSSYSGYSQTDFYHSGRDFPSGTLIQTNINYAVTYGDPWVLEIRGFGYNGAPPFDIQLAGYIYYDTIINQGGYSNGTNISGLRAINYNGNLCFWFPYQGYWQGYNVKAYVPYEGRQANRVTSISNTGQPTTAKQVDFNLVQSLHSSNYNSYSPTLTGGNASGTWGINITGNSSNITAHTINQSVGTGNTPSFAGATLGCGVATGRGVYGPGTLNLVLLSSSAGSDGVSGIDFRSGNNYPSDGATIYYENSQTGSGEVSRLVFRVENDLNDSILMRAGYHVYNARTVDMASQGADNPIYRWQYLDSNRMTLDSSGNLVCNGDITAYSDTRVKTDVKVIENSIEKIQAIRGVTFLRTDAQEQDKEKRHAGVIAQEVLEVLPEVVTENAEGMYSVAYGNIVALLIEGMKEQQTQIEELKNEIKELKNK